MMKDGVDVREDLNT